MTIEAKLDLIPILLDKVNHLENLVISLTNKNSYIDLTKLENVSKYLNVSRKTIYNYIDDGRFKENIHYKKVLNKNSVRIRFIENAIINFKKGL